MAPAQNPPAVAHPELDLAMERTRRWIDGLSTRPIPASASIEAVRGGLAAHPPAGAQDPVAVIQQLVDAVEPGLMGVGSSKFYGWVMGGSLPAALAADWLVSAWDQNAGMRDATPGVVGVEEVAAAWLLELLGLPAESGVGFVTGATMANFSCLAAARESVLAAVGWDVARDGMSGAPRVRVLAGAERHGSVDLALRYLGLGAPELVAVDGEGRLDAVALRAGLASGDGPTIVVLQAGNIHSGAFDPFADAVAAAHEVDAWVHVDGAFGLWAAVTPTLDALTAGIAGADSWATDAHKTLNVPYDGGIAIVADQAVLAKALGVTASYLLASTSPDPLELTPEMSRRARGIPVWAALASLGVSGVCGLVEGLVAAAQAIAAALAQLPGATILNAVDYTQVCVAFESDERTREVMARLLAEGEVRPSVSSWHGRAVIRISVSNYQTDAAAVADTVAAFARAAS